MCMVITSIVIKYMKTYSQKEKKEITMSKPRSKKKLTILCNPKDDPSMNIGDVIQKYFPKKDWEVVSKTDIPATFITDALIVICDPGAEDRKEEQISKLIVRPKHYVVWIGNYRNLYYTQGIIVRFNSTHLDPSAVFKAATKPLKKKKKPTLLIVARQYENDEDVPYMDAVKAAFKKAGWLVKRRVEEIPDMVTTDCMVVIALKPPHHHEGQFLRMITVPPPTIWWGALPDVKNVRKRVYTIKNPHLVDWGKQVERLSRLVH